MGLPRFGTMGHTSPQAPSRLAKGREAYGHLGLQEGKGVDAGDGQLSLQSKECKVGIGKTAHASHYRDCTSGEAGQ